MHIAEGMLPAKWAIAYYGLAGIFIAKGLRDYKLKSKETPVFKQLIGVMTAAVFIISLLPIPVPIAGTSSHPGGTPLAAILMGPFLVSPMSLVALLFQALFLAHGGLTTLGANVVSLGVLGGGIGYLVFRLARNLNVPLAIAAGIAGFVGDLAIYLGTTGQLAFAIHGSKPVSEVFLTIFTAFMPAQFPLALLEGVFTGMVMGYLYKVRPDILVKLKVIKLTIDPTTKGVSMEVPNER